MKKELKQIYSLNEVRCIALEYRNTSIYAHSHGLTRDEIKAKLKEIDMK